MDKRLLILPLVFFFMLSACDQSMNVSRDEDEAPAPGHSEKEGLFLRTDQLVNAGIQYGEIGFQQLSSDVNARGKLVLPVNAKADIVSFYPGLIKEVFVKEGDKVSRGKVLASMNSPEFIDAQQHYLMVKNQLVMLEQEYERQKELNKDKIASDKFYQKAESNYQVALAELNGLGLQLEMAGINISRLETGEIAAVLHIIALLHGHVESINANPGKYIMQEGRLMSIINREQLLIELNVFEKDIMKIELGQRVTFILSNLGKEVYEAKVVSIGNMVREENRVVRVLAEFENPRERMLPGMFVAAKIHTGENEVEALPEEAVVRLVGNEHIIFYTLPDKQAEDGTSFYHIAVETGFVEDGFIQVSPKEELPPNALIVTSGAYFLKTEMTKQAE